MNDQNIPQGLDFKQVQFSGKAGEWFGIWIVNLLLSIITIGIYSAWAKVRQHRYFYGNTTIEGRAFDYHATGKQILIGRLIVIAALVVISVISGLFPPFIILVYIAGFFLVPYLLMRSARFNARNTSWSNVRFNFGGDYGDAIATFLLFPMLVAVTLYTTIPLLTRKSHKFYINNHSIGGKTFHFDCQLGPIYKAFGLAFVWVLVTMVPGIFLFISMLSGLNDPSSMNDPLVQVGPIIVLYAFMLISFLPAVVIYQTMVRNTVYANTTLQGGHRFASTIKPMKMLWIAVTNTLAIIFTLGLALPWTQIRITRYLAENTFVAPNGSLDAFVGDVQQDQSAIGDAFSDIEGFDIGGVGL